jgi:hypothetical protein
MLYNFRFWVLCMALWNVVYDGRHFMTDVPKRCQTSDCNYSWPDSGAPRLSYLHRDFCGAPISHLQSVEIVRGYSVYRDLHISASQRCPLLHDR